MSEFDDYVNERLDTLIKANDQIEAKINGLVEKLTAAGLADPGNNNTLTSLIDTALFQLSAQRAELDALRPLRDGYPVPGDKMPSEEQPVRAEQSVGNTVFYEIAWYDPQTGWQTNNEEQLEHEWSTGNHSTVTRWWPLEVEIPANPPLDLNSKAE